MRIVIVIIVLVDIVGNGVLGRGGGGGFRGGGGRSTSGRSGGSWFGSGRSTSSTSSSGRSTSSGGTSSRGSSSYGWKSLSTGTASKSNLPSSNIGPRGYPVQKSQPSPSPARLSPYSPNDPRRGSPPPSYNSIYGSHGAGGSHQNWGPPPPYSSRASYYGLSSGAYPRQSGYGYPGGQTYHQPSYLGMNSIPPTINYNYGYAGSGPWGQPYHQSSGFGGFLLGYHLGSHSIYNPWGYGSYGHSTYYQSPHRNDRYLISTDSNATPEMDPCFPDNPANGLSPPVVNSVCSCDPISFSDATGRQATQYRCTHKGVETYDWNQLYEDVPEYAPNFKDYLPFDDVQKGPQQFKLKALTLEAKREEAFAAFEKLVNMGRFVVPATIVEV